MVDRSDEGGDPACWAHLYEDSDADGRSVVSARIVGVPAPGVAVWVSTDDPEVAGDLEPAPEGMRADDLVVLAVERHGFRWVVADVVEHLPASRPPARPPRPHAHPARPPGTVLIAWLPFTSDGEEGPGKHRPCVVLRSTDPSVVRVRPLYDPGSSIARRSGGVQLEGWHAAGLDKASVAVDPVEVPVARCEQTIGALTPHDRARLGIDSG